MNHNKGIAPILIILIIIGVLVLGGGIYYFLVKKTQKPVACTREAKICPDGSAVSRTGPNCEFAECPTVKTGETANWKTYRNEYYGYEIKYPVSWILDSKIRQGSTINSPENEKLFQDIQNGMPYDKEYVRDITISFINNRTINELLAGYKDINPLQITFASEKAYEVILPTTTTYNYVIIIEKDSNLYTITFGNRTNKSQLTETDKEILSTFKFIEPFTKEQSCINSGGTVTSSLCCKSSGDFPGTCHYQIGACGCSATDSHQVKTCDCGANGCWNGFECVQPLH
jgi:hypothetical protein